MRYYETIYIVNPNLDNEVLDKTMVEIGKELDKTKSKLINHRIWVIIHSQERGKRVNAITNLSTILNPSFRRKLVA